VAGVVFYMYVLDDVLNSHMPRGYGITLGATLMLLAIVFVFANVLLQEPDTWYHRFLSTRPLVYLGRISYSVYLWQQIFLTSANTTVLGRFPLNLVASIAAGWLSYRCIELPFIQIKDRYFHARGGGKPAIAVAEATEPAATTSASLN
jgi:peptidoglycan/LPS O-acetylase OafA/YrhL